jgi:hypothetical protein
MNEPEFPTRSASQPTPGASERGLPDPPAPEQESQWAGPAPASPWAGPAPANPWAGPAADPPASPGASGDAWASTPDASPGPARRRRPAAVVAAVLALALVAGGGTYAFLRTGSAPTGPPTTLLLSFDRGDETRYDIHMTMDGSVDLGAMGEQPLNVDMTQSVGWKVVEVDDEGVATVRISVDGVTGSANGVPLPADAAGRSMTLRVAQDGQIVDGNGLGFGATGSSGFGGFPGMDQVTPILPDHEVAPGDEWDKHFSQAFPFGGGTIEYTAHSRFERYERVGGVRAAVVDTAYTVPLDFSIDLGDLAKAMGEGTGGLPGLGGKDLTMTYGGSGTFDQTSWLDLDGRQLLRSTSRGDFDMTISFPGLQAQLGTDGFHMEATFSLEMTRR